MLVEIRLSRENGAAELALDPAPTGLFAEVTAVVAHAGEASTVTGASRCFVCGMF